MIMQTYLLGIDHRAAAQIFDERNTFLPCECGNLRGHRRFDETAHKKITAMDFENERRLLGNGARIVGEGGLVGRADFSQLGATRFQNLADPKTAADLHQLSAGNDNFGFIFCEMANDQDQRGGAVIYDRCRFSAAKFGQRLLDETAAIAAVTRRKGVFEVAVSGSNGSHSFSGFCGKRRALQISVSDDSGSIDNWSKPAGMKPLQRLANEIDDLFKLRNFALNPNFRELASNKIDDDWTRQVN